MKNSGKGFHKLPLASASGQSRKTTGFSRILKNKFPLGLSLICAKATRKILILYLAKAF